MTQLVDQAPQQTPVEIDIVAAVHAVLTASSEPLTISKIRAHLPTKFRTQSLEELGEVLRRQVAANALLQYPKYRSQQDRFWDRPMPVHVAALIRETLQERPMPLSELRRKLPAYARGTAETVLMEQVSQGMLYRHPRGSKRGGDFFGAQAADAKDYLRDELSELFQRLELLGFTMSQLRSGALEILHDDEWSPTAAESEDDAEETGSETNSGGEAPSAVASAGQAPPIEQSETLPNAPAAVTQT